VQGTRVRGTHTLSFEYIYILCIHIYETACPPAGRIFLFSCSPTAAVSFLLVLLVTIAKLGNCGIPEAEKSKISLPEYMLSLMCTCIYIYYKRARTSRGYVAAEKNSKLKKARKGRRNQRADWISNGEKELRIKKEGERTHTRAHAHTTPDKYFIACAECLGGGGRGRKKDGLKCKLI